MVTGLAELDLLRHEQRFFLWPPAAEGFSAELRRGWREVQFSDRPHVLTIYLESDEHDVPFGTSVKLRRFLPQPADALSRGDDGTFQFEIKGTRGETERTKTTRRATSLPEAIAEARAALNIPTLRAYLAVGYERRHFVPRDGTPLRVTLDRDIRFWYFVPGDEYATPLGTEEISRFEVKLPIAGGGHFPAWEALRGVLAAHGALPINSKRTEGFARIGQYLTARFGRGVTRDLIGQEIEAKLLVLCDDPPLLFRFLKECLRNGGPIRLAGYFPYTIDAETVNQYWAEERDGKLADGLKVLLRGDHFGSVEKSDTDAIDSSAGIVKRREVKSPIQPYHPEAYRAVVDEWMTRASSPRFLGYLTRWRRAIWPEEAASGRIYHISLDRCHASRRPEPLWQLEIEYVGRRADVSGGGDPEQVVVEEIHDLAHRLLERANRKGRSWLVPTTLTKFQWLSAT